MNTELSTAERIEKLLAAFEPTLSWTKHRTCYVASNGATITWERNGARKIWKLSGHNFATLTEAKSAAQTMKGQN